MGEENKDDTKRSSRGLNTARIVAYTSIAAAVAIGLVVAFQMTSQRALPPPAESVMPITNVSRVDDIIYGNFSFHRCGELTKDPEDVPGAPENPAKLSRSSGEEVIIPLCIVSANNNNVYLVRQIELRDPEAGEFEVLSMTTMQDGAVKANSTEGLTVSLGKSAFRSDAMERLDTELTGDKEMVGETFDVVITAGADAELGTQLIGIALAEPDASGVRAFGSTLYLYVDIVE